jgi:Flp pilus assembly protein TadD
VLLATASDGNFRDYSRALELAKQAVDLSPDEPGFWGARGIALYRNCEWTAAKTDLQKSTAGRTLKTPDDLANQAELCFFLAMAHWQLGEKKEARMCYDKAVECMGKRGDMVATFLKRERAEAAELLGLEKNRAPGPLII